MKLAMWIFVLAIFVGFASLSLAAEIVTPAPIPPGYMEGGPFQGNPMAAPDVTPNPSGPLIDIPERRSKNPDGDVAPPGTPVIKATPR